MAYRSVRRVRNSGGSDEAAPERGFGGDDPSYELRSDDSCGSGTRHAQQSATAYLLHVESPVSDGVPASASADLSVEVTRGFTIDTAVGQPPRLSSTRVSSYAQDLTYAVSRLVAPPRRVGLED